MSPPVLRHTARRRTLLLALALLAVPALARADVPAPAQQPAPAPASTPAPAAPNALDQIDFANIVTSAAKGVTTVQEAPAIITIITAEEIRQRGYRELGEVLASIPGWMDTRAEGNQIAAPLVRGTIQGVLLLRDGVSMFDPVLNVASMGRTVPLESIKRIEVVTGPGGVLWGANSFLGIVNIITKDGPDVNGLEMSAGYGDGPGNAQDFRAYAMYGKSFFKDRLRVFLHASYENFLGQKDTGRQYLAGSPTPQPYGPALYGTTAATDIARSWLLNLDGKISAGPVSLYFNVPIGELNYALTFGPPLIVKDKDGNCAMGRAHCDRSTWNYYDRYAVLEYRDRFFKEKFGLDLKAYYIQFNREFQPRIFPSSAALPGGLNLDANARAQRVGGTFDIDYTGPWSWNRVLAGGEVFWEQVNNATNRFPEPAAEDLPIVCPLQADGKTLVPGCPVTFINGAQRTVAGLFVADQIRPVRQLTLDGGVRYQQGFGPRGYKAQVLGSAAAVWQIVPQLHLKLDWSQGFRPPVFNNTDGNGNAVQFAGNPRLQVERSESYSAELNARVLRNVRGIRELQLRLDYAYTLLDDIIVVRGGQYENSGRRAIHSVEFLGRLYLAGDHYLSLAYTFQRIATSDSGIFRSMPEHYFQLGAVFNAVRDLLTLNTNLNVYAGTDDPNRYPSAPTSIAGGGGSEQVLRARLTDFTYDRLPPVALLQLGARLHLFHQHLTVSAQFYNVLNQTYYYPDVFFDQAPVVEVRPNPGPKFSFFAAVTYRL